MSFWTTGHEDVLRELCWQGAEAVSKEIERRYGVYHSPHACEMHASRIHVSLRKLSVCPDCGAVGVHLNRQTGLCPLCTERQHVAEEQAFNELLEAERDKAENSPEIEELRRKYAALRQRNARLRKRYGLPGKKERSE